MLYKKLELNRIAKTIETYTLDIDAEPNVSEATSARVERAERELTGDLTRKLTSSKPED